MSHFSVLVIGENVNEQLAPFDENLEIEYVESEEEGEEGYYHNPNAKWDWYQLGGRWTGSLKLKEGKFGKIGSPGILTESAEEGWVDQSIKKFIDFEGMKQDYLDTCSEKYEQFHSVLNGRELPIHLLEQEKYEDWRNNEIVQDMNKNLDFFMWLNWGSDKEIDQYLLPKEEFLECKSDEYAPSFAILKDGVWYERGNMGWFGCVTDSKNGKEFSKNLQEILDSVDDNEIISMVDCHI